MVADMAKEGKEPLRVVFFHLDLGIGGAENLVVSAAEGLQRLGHHVEFYTSHHDVNHCFQSTKDGTLKVTVAGDWLPRTVLGHFTVVCAIIRMIYLCVYAFLSGARFDVAINDQVSFINPLLHLIAPRVVFYCHFPDQLLCADRKLAIKRLYRYPVDRMEELTTGMADCIAVNSNFTRQTTRATFPSLKNMELRVVYPPVDLSATDAFLKDGPKIPSKDEMDPSIAAELIKSGFYVSLNRYERKKNIGLAVEAYKLFLSSSKADGHATGPMPPRLVIAGGYDSRVPENVEHYKELKKQAQYVVPEVVFMRSVSDNVRLWLLRNALATLYTPSREHFGIVPCESMALGTPVIAPSSGGPLESICDGKTGRLCAEGPAEPYEFCRAMKEFQHKDATRGKACEEWVRDKFGLDHFASELDQMIRGTCEPTAGTSEKQEKVEISKQKVLLARQFVDMSRLKMEGLLGAFMKLVEAQKSDHTYIETENIRYVYQPIEQLYLVLITTRQSNILEDLDTLKLFTTVVPEVVQNTVCEGTVLDNAFDLVFAFDEIISFGYREAVTLSQIKTYTEMDSHEERLAQMIEQSKMNEAKEVAKKKQLELARQRALLAKQERLRGRAGMAFDSSPTGFGGSAVTGFGGDGDSSPVGASTSAGRFEGGGFTSAAPELPTTRRGGSDDYRYEDAYPVMGGPKKGLVLGRKKAQQPGTSAAVVSKQKVLLARQFVDVSRLRMEGLLGAFMKLVESQKSDHTYIETENIRYVYQPIEQLYLVLITTRQSNILEDLDTLKLFTNVVQDVVKTSVTEDAILDNAFDLVFAFDEIISFGYREAVTLSQIKTYTEMDSHEERLAQMIEQSKMNEAKEVAKKKQLELARQRAQQAREAKLRSSRQAYSTVDSLSSPTGFGNDSTIGDYSTAGGDYPAASSTQSRQQFQGGGFTSAAAAAASSEGSPSSYYQQQQSFPSGAPKKGLVLGRKRHHAPQGAQFGAMTMNDEPSADGPRE
ncbi:Alpha-1,3-mannosyltransferase-like protein [Perkinsus chesapeaki]|uniref:Coatomer subunit delta n=1 Tax=Perkinsus chesapeaki TaxID=330153 RepID=A0A7J6M0Q0_PERCH|nr:Alpha-1,3-mannosyltransferase-like protein [Perkinsus chesapeaki]